MDAERLQDFIDEAGLSYKENSRSFVFDCPRCHRTDKLYMEKRSGRFICFFCAEVDGYKGKPEFALSDLAAMSIRDVRKALYGESSVNTGVALDLQLSDFFGDEDTVEEQMVEIPTMRWPVECVPIDSEHGKKGAAYLATRGIDLAMAKKYGLRYWPTKRRVCFPVELNGRLVGWQERIITDPKVWSEEDEKFLVAPKMLSSKDIPTANVVMFADNLKGSEHVVVCEGPIDAIKADLCGGNIATMGKAIGQGQVDAIRNPEKILSPQLLGALQNGGIKRVYLALDPDAARETARLVRDSFCDLEVYLMHPPHGRKDLGEMDYCEVYDLFLSARPIDGPRVFIHFGR
jgi:hypothetical protein